MTVTKRWRSKLFSSEYRNGSKVVHLLQLGGPAGVIVYIDSPLLAVADWEGSPGGVLIWRNRIALVAPDAGVPDDLTLTRIVNDIRDAFEQAGKMKLFVSEVRLD